MHRSNLIKSDGRLAKYLEQGDHFTCKVSFDHRTLTPLPPSALHLCPVIITGMQLNFLANYYPPNHPYKDQFEKTSQMLRMDKHKKW